MSLSFRKFETYYLSVKKKPVEASIEAIFKGIKRKGGVNSPQSNVKRTGRSPNNASMWNTASVTSRGGESFEKIIAWGSVYFR